MTRLVTPRDENLLRCVYNGKRAVPESDRCVVIGHVTLGPNLIARDLFVPRFVAYLLAQFIRPLGRPMPIVTTYLEMRSPDDLDPKRCADPHFWIDEVTVKQWQFNRLLYLVVGSPWAWNDKRSWSDAQWKDYAESDCLRTFIAYYDASPAGYYELRWDDDSGVEIAYFGLLPAFIGRGFGGVLLTHALEEAWRMAPTRVWVHTCTLDHPAALANYQARGMKIYHVEAQETT